MTSESKSVSSKMGCSQQGTLLGKRGEERDTRTGPYLVPSMTRGLVFLLFGFYLFVCFFRGGVGCWFFKTGFLW